MNLRNIQDLIDTIADELMEDDLMDVNSSKPVPDDEEEYVEVVPENKLTSYSLAEGFWLFKIAFDFFYDIDTSVIGALN